MFVTMATEITKDKPGLLLFMTVTAKKVTKTTIVIVIMIKPIPDVIREGRLRWLETRPEKRTAFDAP